MKILVALATDRYAIITSDTLVDYRDRGQTYSSKIAQIGGDTLIAHRGTLKLCADEWDLQVGLPTLQNIVDKLFPSLPLGTIEKLEEIVTKFSPYFDSTADNCLIIAIKVDGVVKLYYYHKLGRAVPGNQILPEGKDIDKLIQDGILSPYDKEKISMFTFDKAKEWTEGLVQTIIQYDSQYGGEPVSKYLRI